MTDTREDQPHNNAVKKLLKDVRQRMVRVESRVTSFMRYHGFRPGVDLQTERVNRVFVVEGGERPEVHVSSPDVPLGLILDGVIEEQVESADLYVSGVRCGIIMPSAPANEEGHNNG